MESKKDLIHCPICDVPARVLHRDRPKGERAKSVCINCLPPEMVPSDEEREESLNIWRAINGK